MAHAESVRAYYASFNERKPGALDALVTPAFRQHGAGYDSDLAALKGFRAMYATAFPDVQCEARELHAGADAVTMTTTTTGTHRGAFLGHAATQRSFRATAIDVFRFEGDLIAELWSEFDTFGMLRQLGIAGSK